MRSKVVKEPLLKSRRLIPFVVCRLSENRKSILCLALTTITGLLFTACVKPVQMDGVSTSSLYAYYRVSGYASSTYASCLVAFQNKDTGEQIELSENDTLTCDGVVMEYSSNALAYIASVPQEAGKSYVIQLIRDQESPHAAMAVMPEPVSSISPSTGVNVKKGDPFPVSWTPSNNSADSVSVMIYANTYSISDSYSMTSTIFKQITNGPPEAGSVQFSGSDTQTIPASSGTLTGEYQLTRTRPGILPSAIQGEINASFTTPLVVYFID